MRSKSADPRQNGFFASFMRGLTQPSWTALASTLLSTLLLFTALTSMTMEKLALDNIELFRASGPVDSSMDATVRSLQLRRDRQSPRPALLLIGEKSWGRELSASLADPNSLNLEVIDLTTTGQTLWESEALIDWTSNRTGVVLFDASLDRFLEPSSQLKRLAVHPKLGFRSRAFDREIESAGLPTRSIYDRYLLDNVSFFVDRWPNALVNATLGTKSESAFPTEDREHSPSPRETDAQRTFEVNKKAFSRFVEIATRKTRFAIIVLASNSPDDPPALVEQRDRLVANLANTSRVRSMTNDSNASPVGRDRLLAAIQELLGQKHD